MEQLELITTPLKIKIYRVGETDTIRIFGEGPSELQEELYNELTEGLDPAYINDALHCVETSADNVRDILEIYPEATISLGLDSLLKIHPEILRPVRLPDPDYWQSLLPPQITLRPFQIEYLNWTEGRRQLAYPPNGSQVGVICSLDQGLGKTVVAITWDQHLRELDLVKSTLVICRNNNKHPTWVKHIEDLTDLDLLVIEGNRPKRRELLKQFRAQDADVAIINYETMRLHPEELIGVDHVIIDEAHKVANRKSKQSIVANAISRKAVWTTELTGGVAQNRVETQLFHPLSLCDRHVWSSYAKWEEEYCIIKTIKIPLYRNGRKVINPQTGGPVLREMSVVDGIKNRQKLSAEIAPYIYQRSKQEVASQLPPKIFQTIDTYLTKRQRQLYTEVRDDIRTQINGVSIPIALTKTLRLFQLCATLEYFDLGDESRKADEASELIYDIVPLNHKALVFTQHVLLAGAVYRRLIKLGARALLLTGTNPRKTEDKDRVKQQFKVGDEQFLVTTIQLEGEGSDYPEADHVFRLDRDHRPLVNTQASDRAHRLTSVYKVLNVIDFVTADSIEETQMKILEEKQSNISGVLDLAKTYTMNDIERLLEKTPRAE